VNHPRPCGDGALWEIWAAGASHAGGSSSPGHSAALSHWGYWGPPIHTMGLCSRPTGIAAGSYEGSLADGCHAETGTSDSQILFSHATAWRDLGVALPLINKGDSTGPANKLSLSLSFPPFPVVSHLSLSQLESGQSDHHLSFPPAFLLAFFLLRFLSSASAPSQVLILSGSRCQTTHMYMHPEV